MEESQHTTSSFDPSVICESIMGFLAYFCATVLLFKKEFYLRCNTQNIQQTLYCMQFSVLGALFW